jgi:hypothetical protein
MKGVVIITAKFIEQLCYIFKPDQDASVNRADMKLRIDKSMDLRFRRSGPLHLFWENNPDEMNKLKLDVKECSSLCVSIEYRQS